MAENRLTLLVQPIFKWSGTIFAGMLLAALPFTGCRNAGYGTGDTEGIDSVVVDTAFTELFKGDAGGLTGADGTYSVLLPDGRTAWIFGDSFIEGVNPDNTRERQDPIYIRNSVVLQDGDKLTTLYQHVDGRRASFAIHPASLRGKQFREDSVWFWPGDGYVEEDHLNIFFSEFVQADTGMWGFDWRGTWLASYSLPDLEQTRIIQLFDRSETNIHFGHAVLEEESYIYVYGAGEGKPCAARFRKEAVTDPWEFYDGSGWQDDIGQAASMGDMHGSEQFSVLKLEDTYVLITQMGGISDRICSYTAESPVGPWGNRQLLYTTPLPDSTDNLFTYNAVAHPQFNEDQMLLISYNTNSKSLEDHFRNASIYRPRFIRVPFNMILDGNRQQQEE